jgi:glycosyltransferase 2 family protein
MNRKGFKLIGFLIVTCSFIFVAYRVWNVFPEIDFGFFHYNIYLYFFLITLCYSIAVFFVSLAWKNFLVSLNEDMAGFIVSQKIYSRSVIAKYVPVGILEYAGRHVLAGEHGLSQGAIATANLWEVLCQVFVACVLVLVSLSLSGNMPQLISIKFLFAVIIVLLLIFLGFNIIIKSIPRLVNQINIAPLKFRFFIVPIFFYVCFFIILAAVLMTVILNVDQMLNMHEVTYIFAISTFAWLLGYITPGAPAGLGVREATLLLGINEIVSEPNAIVIIGIFRLITVSGDLLYFAIGYLLSHFNRVA